MFYSSYYNSPVSKLLLASDGTNLTGLWIENRNTMPIRLPMIFERKMICRSLSKPKHGWTDILKATHRLYPICPWRLRVEPFGRWSGKYYVKFLWDR